MNQKISARTLADSLTGDEKIPIGVAGDLATTPNQLKDFIGGGGILPTTSDVLIECGLFTSPSNYVLIDCGTFV